MTPYADLLFFGVSLYALLPAIALGLAGRLTWRWAALSTLLMVTAQFTLAAPGSFRARGLHLGVVFGFVTWQYAVSAAFLRWRRAKRAGGVWVAVLASLLPLLAVKFVLLSSVRDVLGFVGISYVSFRALDVVLAVHDGLTTELPPARYATYLLFFPTLSAGPIDRWRRFAKDLDRVPSRQEYLDLLDHGVSALFAGLLYKFVVAALLRTYWMDPAAAHPGVRHTLSYMYAYSAYLFFDFAGYSAFAIAFSCVLGIRTPANFNKPFLAANIAEFWTRWHISLSSWLRDQIYMRFLLANSKRKWIAARHVASGVALALTFGAMGLWHGTAARYLVYGLYHALLMIALEWWRRRTPKGERREPSTLVRASSILITVQAVCFGFLIFSGRLF